MNLQIMADYATIDRSAFEPQLGCSITSGGTLG